MIDGALSNVNEIEVVLEHARLAWVQSVRATGKPMAPQWIMKERDLQDYFDALGSAGFDLGILRAMNKQPLSSQRIRIGRFGTPERKFLWEVLSSCGWQGDQTDVPFNMPTLSTTYLSWWALKPREVVKRFRTKLRRILLEAGIKVKSLSRAKREKEENKRLAEGIAHVMGIAGAKPIKPPTTTAKTAGAKKSKFKRASKRKSTHRQSRAPHPSSICEFRLMPARPASENA